MALILVQPPPPSAPGLGSVAWAHWSSDGRQLVGQGESPVSLLPGQHELVLIVPASALSWHAVTLPPGSLQNAARLRSVLSGLLEDRLLDDPEQLHFALAPGAQAGAPAWVATCRRDWLQTTLQAIEATGRRVSRLVPEFAPQPEGQRPNVFVTGDADAPWLTLCDAQGVLRLPLSASTAALAVAQSEAGEAMAEPAVAAVAEQLLGRALPLLPTAERWLQASQSGWDLAQFEFATTGSARARKQAGALMAAVWRAPRWRAARWGAALLVVLQLVGLNAWAFKERRALEAKRQQVRQVLTQTFPHVSVVLDAPLQMSREVAALQAATGGLTAADLEPMLAALAGSLPAGRVPSAIDYSGSQLRLRGVTLSPAEMESVQAGLRSRGYNARGEGDLLLVQAEAAR